MHVQNWLCQDVCFIVPQLLMDAQGCIHRSTPLRHFVRNNQRKVFITPHPQLQRMNKPRFWNFLSSSSLNWELFINHLLPFLAGTEAGHPHSHLQVISECLAKKSCVSRLNPTSWTSLSHKATIIAFGWHSQDKTPFSEHALRNSQQLQSLSGDQKRG